MRRQVTTISMYTGDNGRSSGSSSGTELLTQDQDALRDEAVGVAFVA